MYIFITLASIALKLFAINVIFVTDDNLITNLEGAITQSVQIKETKSTL